MTISAGGEKDTIKIYNMRFMYWKKSVDNIIIIVEYL